MGSPLEGSSAWIAGRLAPFRGGAVPDGSLTDGITTDPLGCGTDRLARIDGLGIIGQCEINGRLGRFQILLDREQDQ